MIISRTALGFEGIEELETGGQLHLSLFRLHEKDSHLVGLLKVRAILDGTAYHIYLGSINITSSQSRRQLSNHIKSLTKGSTLEDVDWDILIENLSAEIYKLYFEPKRPERLTIYEDLPSVEYTMYPLIPKGVPVLVFAPGGVGKSIIALYVCTLYETGYNLWHRPEPHEGSALYVDWELDKALTSKRFSQIVLEGVESKNAPLYMQATHPIREEIENILIAIEEHNVKLIVIDSVAPAIGGDINEASSVIEFFEHIRKITAMGVSILILSHVSKADKQREDGATPVGSVFFENLSRMTWELKVWRSPATEGVYLYALYNRKSNFGYHKPHAIKIAWEEGAAIISPLSMDELKQLGQTGSQKDLILSLLYEYKQMSVEDIAKALGTSKNVIWKVLSQMKAEGLVDSLERGVWTVVR